MKPPRNILRRSPRLRDPDREARERDAYERTSRVLHALPNQQWHVSGPLQYRGAQPAHIVVGPGGVYLVRARKPDGSVRVKDGVPWLRRRGTQGERAGVDVNRKLVEPAEALAREIRGRTGRGPAVHPVIVFWCEFPQRVAETNQLSFVHGSELAGWLRARPPELDHPGLEEVAQVTANIAEESSRGNRAA